jgi:phage terminase small subunit
MPTLRNPRHEKFAQLVASGMTAQAAFTQAGYSAPQNAPRLRSNELVAKRIEELQVRNERKAEIAALTRDELIKILTEIVHAARNRLLETRTADGLKAAEMLAKMCGWNEPEQVKHDHVHLQVDSALIQQLRAGYAELGRRQQQQLAASVAVVGQILSAQCSPTRPIHSLSAEEKAPNARASKCAKRRSKGRRGPHRLKSIGITYFP